MQEILEFLGELEKNNHRDWFHDHKAHYNRARDRFLAELQKIIDQLQLHDPRLAELEPKNALFRIFRDIRFSKDKTPYKTHFGAYMARGGRKSSQAGYYLHIGTGEKFLAAGVHSPAKEHLQTIRQEIIYRPDTYNEILENLQAKGFAMYEKDKLKKGPKGFPADSPVIEHLKNKHFLLSCDLPESEVRSGNLARHVTNRFIQLTPYTTFLNEAMEYTGNE